MHIGLVGLGKMGNNMRARLRNAGIEVTGYDANPAVSDVADLGALAQALPSPRLVWVMVPHGQITDAVIKDLGHRVGRESAECVGHRADQRIGNKRWLLDRPRPVRLWRSQRRCRSEPIAACRVETRGVSRRRIVVDVDCPAQI